MTTLHQEQVIQVFVTALNEPSLKGFSLHLSFPVIIEFGI
jgi:hypothetical protein